MIGELERGLYEKDIYVFNAIKPLFFCTITVADTNTDHTYGPMVGAVTENSATIWFRVKPSANVQVEYATSRFFNVSHLISKTVTTSKRGDYTGMITVYNLLENTTYYYRILINGSPADFPPYARFKTFSRNAQSVKIGILTDLRSAKDKTPATAIEALSKDKPDFVLVLGDWDHSDPVSLKDMRRMHCRTRGETVSGITFRDYILHKFPVAHVWDDHDYGGNNTNKTFVKRLRAIKANDEYWPSYNRPNPSAGIWHKFTYGSLVEVFMLDLRSQRDLNSAKDRRYIAGKEPNYIRDSIRNDP